MSAADNFHFTCPVCVFCEISFGSVEYALVLNDGNERTDLILLAINRRQAIFSLQINSTNKITLLRSRKFSVVHANLNEKKNQCLVDVCIDNWKCFAEIRMPVRKRTRFKLLHQRIRFEFKFYERKFFLFDFLANAMTNSVDWNPFKISKLSKKCFSVIFDGIFHYKMHMKQQFLQLAA